MDWGRVLEIGLTVVVIPLIIWNIKTLMEVRTTLFGVGGQNGLRSQVRDLEAASSDHDRRLTILETKEAA